MSYIDENEVSNLSDAQEMALSLLPIPSTILSIIGSSIIIHLVVQAKPSKRGPYMRILFGMSICDVITSLAWALQSFLMPASTSQRVWAFGNDASCTAMGFLTQFAFSCFLYYGMLSFYYAFTIRWGMRDEKFARYVEPFMHVISVGYPLITASVGAAMGMFHENELGIGCWVNDYPRNCGFDLTETGIECLSPLIAWIMGGSVILFILASLLVTNTIIYLHVRFTIARARRFANFQPPQEEANNLAATTTTTKPNRQRRKRQSNNNNDSQTRRVRAVAAQCFLYVGAFVLSYTWTIAIRILEGTYFEAKDEASIYFLLVGQAIFGPLAGFLNLIVYIRPRYLRCRKDFAQESKWWAAKRALFGEQIQRTRTTGSMITGGVATRKTISPWSLSHSNPRSSSVDAHTQQQHQHRQQQQPGRISSTERTEQSKPSAGTATNNCSSSSSSMVLPHIPSSCSPGAEQEAKLEMVDSPSSPAAGTTATAHCAPSESTRQGAIAKGNHDQEQQPQPQ